jgi:DnaJ-class molecular chaperone
MIDGYIQCPDCKGSGKSRGFACGPGFHHAGAIPCVTCKGWGEVEADFLERRAEGARIRDERRARRVTQREAARERGMDVAEYSRLEHPTTRRGYKDRVWEECRGREV